MLLKISHLKKLLLFVVLFCAHESQARTVAQLFQKVMNFTTTQFNSAKSWTLSSRRHCAIVGGSTVVVGLLGLVVCKRRSSTKPKIPTPPPAPAPTPLPVPAPTPAPQPVVHPTDPVAVAAAARLALEKCCRERFKGLDVVVNGVSDDNAFLYFSVGQDQFCIGLGLTQNFMLQSPTYGDAQWVDCSGGFLTRGGAGYVWADTQFVPYVPPAPEPLPVPLPLPPAPPVEPAAPVVKTADELLREVKAACRKVSLLLGKAEFSSRQRTKAREELSQAELGGNAELAAEKNSLIAAKTVEVGNILTKAEGYLETARAAIDVIDKEHPTSKECIDAALAARNKAVSDITAIQNL